MTTSHTRMKTDLRETLGTVRTDLCLTQSAQLEFSTLFRPVKM